MCKKSAKTDQAKNPQDIGSSLAAKRAQLFAKIISLPSISVQYSVFVQVGGRQPGVAHPKPTLSHRSCRPAAAGTRNPLPSGAPSQVPFSIQPPERLWSRPHPSPANRVRVGRAVRAAGILASLETSDGRRWAGRRRELWRAAAAVPSWRERRRQNSCSRGSTSCPGQKTTFETDFLLI